MTGLTTALWVEVLKFRRSKAPLLSALVFTFIPVVFGFFMLLLRDPELASRLGIVTTKVQMTIRTADWPAYFGLLAQATAAGGLFLFGLLVTWIFGREYGDRTAKDLLALPTARGNIVLAKFIVTMCWSIVLLVLTYGVSLVVGSAVGLPGWSAELAQSAAGAVALTGGLTILLALPFALAASAGRGYLPPFGFILLAAALAQVAIGLGWGPYFPWSVAGLASGAAGAQPLGALSYAIVVFTGLAGIAGTLAWWQLADQT
jgi:ABC-2 type transport system permease protein